MRARGRGRRCGSGSRALGRVSQREATAGVGDGIMLRGSLMSSSRLAPVLVLLLAGCAAWDNPAPNHGTPAPAESPTPSHYAPPPPVGSPAPSAPIGSG